MVKRVLVTATALAAAVTLSVPAFAATATPTATPAAATPSTGAGAAAGGGTAAGSKTAKTWYVAQNDKTMACIVTPSKPNGTSYTMIGMMGYMTVKEATTAMRAAMECKMTATAAATKAKT